MKYVTLMTQLKIGGYYRYQKKHEEFAKRFFQHDPRIYRVDKLEVTKWYLHGEPSTIKAVCTIFENGKELEDIQIFSSNNEVYGMKRVRNKHGDPII